MTDLNDKLVARRLYQQGMLDGHLDLGYVVCQLLSLVVAIDRTFICSGPPTSVALCPQMTWRSRQRKYQSILFQQPSNSPACPVIFVLHPLHDLRQHDLYVQFVLVLAIFSLCHSQIFFLFCNSDPVDSLVFALFIPYRRSSIAFVLSSFGCGVLVVAIQISGDHDVGCSRHGAV